MSQMWTMLTHRNWLLERTEQALSYCRVCQKEPSAVQERALGYDGSCQDGILSAHWEVPRFGPKGVGIFSKKTCFSNALGYTLVVLEVLQAHRHFLLSRGPTKDGDNTF